MIILRTFFVLIGLAALIGVIIGAAWVYAGRVEVAADRERAPPVAWLLEIARERAVARRARAVEVDLPDLTEEELLEAVVGYEEMCAPCHAPPGQPPSEMALGLNPPAPDLAELVQQRSAAELFWVTKHGIRMTGMPAWGESHTDAELWAILALINHFPRMADEEYPRLLEAAHVAGVEHEHDHDHVEDEPAHVDETHEDDEAHEHE